MKVYTPDAVRDAEYHLINNRGVSSLGLMKKAASEMHRHVLQMLEVGSSVCVLCGKGNNAGDGYELARLIMEKGYHVCCIRVFDGAPNDSPTTAAALECHNAFVNEGGTVTDGSDNALKAISCADFIIDAVFGIGFNGFIESDSAVYKIIDFANKTNAVKISLDVPSGVNSGDGSVGNIAFRADVTLTVSVIKVGMLSYPARKYCGDIRVIDIGISDSIIENFGNNSEIPDTEYLKRVLPEREADSNKGDFGKLLCICGSECMTGAAVMSVGAALRAGAGLVTLASEKSVCDVVKLKYPEPIYKIIDFNHDKSINTLLEGINAYSAVLVGCGLGKSEKKKCLVESIIKNYGGRLIIDADGINLISDNINILREAKGEVIITPHPGEFSRISGMNIPYINGNRIKCATRFSSQFNCITVLKGAGTVVSDNEKFSVNTSGNPGLAKGGSGDVLAGIISGLAAQKGISPYNAALSGVFLHGKAADVLKHKYSEYGMLPGDIIEEFAKMLP